MAGIDLVAIAESVRQSLTTVSIPLVLSAVGLFLFMRSNVVKRIGRVCEELFFTNWQLGLLTATGVVLSLASGWTTYIGIRNFTSEPILASMIAFGIQGVMLIVSWLIGESFATGMSQQVPSGNGSTDRTSLKIALGVTLFGVAIAVVAAIIQFGAAKSSDVAAAQALPVMYLAAAGIIAIGLLIVASKAHTFRGYFDAMRVIARTSVLWVMFLACAATSVFFSFDSHFTSIFPQSERVRAAELRAQNQVGGVVADIGGVISKQQSIEAEALFGSKGWTDYDDNLGKLANLAQESSGQIDEYFTKLMEDRRRGIAAQQERVATAQSSQAGLSNKKTSMSDELARLKTERPAMVEDVTAKRLVVDTMRNEFDVKRVEAMAEERGVEGTGKVGQGPQFRARKAEEASLQDKIKIAEERLREPQKRLQTTDQRIVQIERELSLIDGEIAKLKGEAQTAESRIKIAEEAKTTEEGVSKIDPARMLPTFEKVRMEFRQSPTAEHLGQVQAMCGQILGAMTATPATKDKVRGIDCDPKSASEAAARVFALNDGIKVFGNNCAGGDKLSQYKSVDALFDFARRCVQDSGLAGKETDELRRKINYVELNRDDKANRFVVTWNAFQDGNRLAYLALAIAIAVDGLIFMSGLFGANAVRSPLSDVPTFKARNAEQLEAIIDNALLPAKFEHARMAIESMHADTSEPGYTAVVELRGLDPERQVVVGKVLNAGATIGAVKRDAFNPQRYFVRPELFEYLSIAATRAFEKNGQLVKEDIEGKIKLSQLEKDVSVALIPQARPDAVPQDLNAAIAHGAQLVLDHLHPYGDPEKTGFRSELRMDEIDDVIDRKIARRALTAGYSMGLVEKAIYDPPVEHRFALHNDFVKVLTRLRGRMLLSTSSTSLQIGQGPLDGGALDGRHALGSNASQQRALPMPSSASQPPRQQQAQPQQAQPPSYDTRARSLPQPPEPTRAAPQAQARPPAALPESDLSDIAREAIEHFGREMSQHTSTIEYLVRHHGALDVDALWRALDIVLRHDDNGLRRPILKSLKSIDQNIDEARESFPSHLMGEPGAAADLNDFADKLKSMQVAMVLLPGAAYDHLINKIEAELTEDNAAGRLDQSRQEKLRLIVEHRSELARAQYTDDHWQAVLKSLMKFDHGLAALAGSDQRPQRMA
jgi:hypothetical protein